MVCDTVAALQRHEWLVVYVTRERFSCEVRTSLHCTDVCDCIDWVVPDSSSGKSRIRSFFGNPGKSGSCQISSWIPVQWKYVQLITIKLTQLTCQVMYYQFQLVLQIQNPLLFAVLQISSKTANRDVTKEALNCTVSIALSMPLVSTAYCSVIPKQVLPKSGYSFGWICVPKSGQVRR